MPERDSSTGRFTSGGGGGGGSSVGKISLDLGINQAGYVQQLNGIAGTATNVLGGAFLKLGGIIATVFATRKLIEFGKDSIELASNLNEVQNVVDVTFGNMSSQIDNFSKNALQQFGLSELAAKQFASVTGAMLKSSGMSGQEVVNMSEGVTKLAADMASFYNLSQSDAFDKIRAGLTGEVMPLRQLGINMSVANLQAFALTQGIKGNYESLSQANQELLRYNYLMSVTKDAQGDFARTSSSWANQTRLLTEQWKIFKTTMGQGFINMLTPVIQGLNLLIAKLQIAAQYFKAFTIALFGSQQPASSTSSATTAAATATDSLGNAVKKTAAAIKGSVSSFDQLNVIGQAASGALGDAAAGVGDLGSMGAGGTPKVDIGVDPSTFAPVKAMLDDIKSTSMAIAGFFKAEFGPSISQAILAIEPVLNSWRESLYNTFLAISGLSKPVKDWFLNDLVPFWQREIFIVGEVTKGLLDTALKVFLDMRNAIYPVLSWFATSGLPLITSFCDACNVAFLAFFIQTKHIYDTLWSDAVAPGLLLLSKIVVDTLDIIKQTWDKYHMDVLGGITVAFENTRKLFDDLWNIALKPIVDYMLQTMTWLWNEHLKGVVQAIADFIGVLVVDVLEIYNKFIVPIVDYLIKKFGPAFQSTIKTIIDIVGTVVGYLADVAKGILKVLTGIIDFITGIFTKDWDKAWKGVGEIVGGVFDIMLAGIKGSINLIIDAVNFLIRALNTIHFETPDWIPGIGGKSFGINIPTVPKLAKGGLVSAPTLAMVGDNVGASADPEVVSPLSKLQGMMGASNQGIIEALMMILEAIENKNTTLEMDGVKLTKIIRANLMTENNRLGKRAITVGGVYV